MISLAIPAATDAYVQALKAAESIGQADVTVLDGPDTTDSSTEGVAVGATTVGGLSGRFEISPSDLPSSGRQTFTLSCLAWTRTGETDFRDARRRCAEIVRDAEQVLATDRTMGGTVSSAFVVGGTFTQRLDADGFIVLIEFRIQAKLF